MKPKVVGPTADALLAPRVADPALALLELAAEMTPPYRRMV